MCGRIIQSSGPLGYAIVDGLDVREHRMSVILHRFDYSRWLATSPIPVSQPTSLAF
jgi:hypothetical protein